jgi:hypothetical protein
LTAPLHTASFSAHLDGILLATRTEGASTSVLVLGPRGAGKTHAVRWAAARHGGAGGAWGVVSTRFFAIKHLVFC